MVLYTVPPPPLSRCLRALQVSNPLNLRHTVLYDANVVVSPHGRPEPVQDDAWPVPVDVRSGLVYVGPVRHGVAVHSLGVYPAHGHAPPALDGHGHRAEEEDVGGLGPAGRAQVGLGQVREAEELLG